MKSAILSAVIFSSLFPIAPLHAEVVIGFAGQEHSETTKLSFLRARFYDPESGAFVSRDPIGIADGLNTYQYAKSNPINRIDRIASENHRSMNITCSAYRWRILLKYCSFQRN